MIIGISGKAGSGKDTVALIIQYLISCKNDTPAGKPWTFDCFVNTSNWQVKRFAGKLKQCVSLILDIPIEDLEEESIKSSKLGKEWIRYGYANSFYRDMNGTPIMNNCQCTKEKYEEELRTNWQTAYKYEYTVRDILQQLGTEVGRTIHSNFWVNALFNSYQATVTKWDDETTDGNTWEYPKWIIPDVRFPNEYKAIEDRGGIVIRVNRESNIGMQHESETALDDMTFAYIIDNDGSIEELIKKVKEILIELKLVCS